MKRPPRLDRRFVRIGPQKPVIRGSPIYWAFRACGRSWAAVTCWCWYVQFDGQWDLYPRLISQGIDAQGCSSSNFFLTILLFFNFSQKPLGSRRGHSAGGEGLLSALSASLRRLEGSSRGGLGVSQRKTCPGALGSIFQLQSWPAPCPCISPGLRGPTGPRFVKSRSP